MRFLTGFAEIADEYDGFILDLWGVIHNGVAPIPGAPECLERLRDAGKRVVLLSNAPRRSETIGRQLEQMGIGRDLYAGIMTSGEASHLMLRDRPDAWYRACGERMFYIGPDRDLGLTDGIALTVTAQPEDATFVLNTGPDYLRPPSDADAFDAVLLRCAARGLPMICANPDLEVIVDGRRVLCAGMLALRKLRDLDPKAFKKHLDKADVKPDEFEQAFDCGAVEVRALFQTEYHDAQVIAALNAGHDLCHHAFRAREKQWFFWPEYQQTGDGNGTLMSIEHDEVA